MEALLADLRSSNESLQKRALYELLARKFKKTDNISLLYAVVKEIENSHSVPVRYFSKRLLDKIESETASLGMKLEPGMISDIEEADIADYISKLQSAERIERENALYYLSIKGRTLHVVSCLEDFAEKTEDETEALIAVEAIEKIQERVDSLKEKFSDENDPVIEDPAQELPEFSEEEQEIFEITAENSQNQERSKKGYSIFSLIMILFVTIAVFVFVVYQNIQSQTKNIAAPQMVESDFRIRVNRFWALSRAKDYNELYAEFGFKDLSRHEYWEKYTLYGNDSYQFNKPEIELKDDRLLVRVKGTDASENPVLLTQYWSKINGKWVPTSKINTEN